MYRGAPDGGLVHTLAVEAGYYFGRTGERPLEQGSLPTPRRPPSSPASESATATQPARHASPARTLRAPNATECRFYGSTPAASVTFRGHQGIIIIARFLKVPGPFCHDCGIATFRQMTADTLTRGWWGVISFFATPITVVVNLSRRNRVASLGPPRKDPSVLAPLAQLLREIYPAGLSLV
jgi:hypothetical protein